ncbi:hypothetical protein AAVH_34876 [Aphelenchoides avenae]|nr:hypothetical protein AAVH_34876 [Aphelenchus avenae]
MALISAPVGGICPTDPIMSMLINNECCYPEPCSDKAGNCMLYTSYCMMSRYQQCMRDKCAATCGFCTPMNPTAMLPGG